MHIYTHKCMHIHNTYLNIHVYTSIYMCVYMHLHLYTCVFMHYVLMYAFVYISAKMYGFLERNCLRMAFCPLLHPDVS